MLQRTFWWAHVLLVLVFLNYLPYSKHLHVITSLPNVFFSNANGPEPKGVIRFLDLEAEGAEQFGAADVDQLTWKDLFDGYSCTECGRCTAVCPANLTGQLLSPRKIIVNMRQRLMELAPAMIAGDATHAIKDHRLLDNFITEEELWACTTCRACVQECPVSIEQLDQSSICAAISCSGSRGSPEVQPVFESMEQRGSPWAFAPADRAKWAAGLDIPTMAEMAARGEQPEVLYWVGCMGSFDDRAKKTSVAFARILKAANVNFAILGQEEYCNGDPARRMGNEYLCQMLAKQNIETLERYGVKTVVTSCPHCFHQIGNEYPQLGGDYDVVHHSTYIERLLAPGRVPLATTAGRGPAHSPTTTVAISAATTTSTTRRARALQARAAGDDPRRAAAHARPRPLLRRRRRADVHGGEGRQAHQRRARRGVARDRRRRDRRGVPVLHDHDHRRREGEGHRSAGAGHCRSRRGAAERQRS